MLRASASPARVKIPDFLDVVPGLITSTRSSTRSSLFLSCSFILSAVSARSLSSDLESTPHPNRFLCASPLSTVNFPCYHKGRNHSDRAPPNRFTRKRLFRG